jgi:hypothetical protein
VSSEQARREGIEELERSYPRDRRRADEDLLKLLGLIEPSDSLRSIEEAVFGEQVAGYYDTRRNRLTLVEDVGGTDAVSLELTLAHELTHALDDARFELEEPDAGTDDRATAYAALVEGTATAIGNRYAERHIDPAAQLTAGLSALGSGALGDFEGLPAYVQAALLFPYLEGATFVERLREVAGGWRLVNFALEKRPPDSTEQVLHPEKYVRFEQPVRLRLRAEAVLGGGWRRAARGTIGEFDTSELLRRGDEDGATRAAAGWGGGRYELWRSATEPAPGCEAPCRESLALLVAWGAAVETGPRTAVLALAPSPELAARLAGSGLRPARPG